MKNASQIATIINEIYDGVERSKVGKIAEKVTQQQGYPDGNKLNTLAMNTFMNVLSSLMPKEFNSKFEHLTEDEGD